MTRAYYNEIDAHAAAWLRALIADGLIPAGDVDERSIVDVQPGDLVGYTQCHFFAGIGGWAHATRLAGWPDDRELWTGSCPCQPFSVAGKGRGTDDVGHLWPDLFRLIRARRPARVVGEQVAGKAGYRWLDGVRADLEGESYACRAVDIPACAVDAPHIRQRLYWVAVAVADIDGRDADNVADAHLAGQRVEPAARLHGQGASGYNAYRRRGPRNGTFWSDYEWLVGADGKARRAQSGIRLLAHRVPGRVGLLRGYGNAIVPQLAAEVLGAFLEAEHRADMRTAA